MLRLRLAAAAIGYALFLSWSLPALAEDSGASKGDVVVLKNGDEYLGRVVATVFRIRGPLGELEFPRHAVTRIHLARGAEGGDVLVSADGDRVSGKLVSTRLHVERTAFAPLDVNLADVAEITLAARRDEVLGTLPTLALQLHNGDALRVAVSATHLTLQTKGGSQRIALSEVRRIDVDELDDAVYGRAIYARNERRLHGKVLEPHLAVSTRAGQALNVPLKLVSAIIAGVPPQEHTAEFVSRPAFDGASANRRFRDRLRSGGVGPELVELPAAAFRRGDVSGDGDSDEQPVRHVTLARPFAIGRNLVSFADYDLFCERTARPKPEYDGEGRAHRPVVSVSWYDATAYAQWLSEQTGHRYRLPTNSEWEYAARGGRETRYPWGDELGEDGAVCAGCGSMWDSRATAPVGSFPPNNFGLYDMAGNVWQWVADCWDVDYWAAPSDGSAYTVGAYCDKKIIRGGSWSYPAREVRVANRWRDFTVRTSDDTGFRLVRESD